MVDIGFYIGDYKVDSIKLGSSDVVIYLGNIQLYPTS